MVIALLVLIVFILLFGAAAVKGFIGNAASLGCGAIIFLGLLMWVGSFFGPDGFEYAIYFVMGLVLALALWVGATGPYVSPPAAKPKQTFHSTPPSREEQKAMRDQYRDR